jgi:general secretion pathway protein A
MMLLHKQSLGEVQDRFRVRLGNKGFLTRRDYWRHRLPDNLSENQLAVFAFGAKGYSDMYESYYGFSEAPFENNLDLRFLFLNEDNKEVLSALLYFIKTRKAFGIVCGDVGTGKTMIISTFLNKLSKSVQPIMISNPYANSLELLQFIAKCLRLPISGENVLELTDKVKDALITAKNKQKQVVLIVDEAHLLSDQSLEEIRLLSNIETSDQKLLQILLFGQYELSHKLDRPEMRHIRQRINVNRFLSPLNFSETRDYIDHRLKVAGSNFERCFEKHCGKLIYKMTQGVPRQINQLCDNALLICMAQQAKKVNRRILRMADEARQTDRIFTPKSFKGKTRFNPWLVPLTGTAVVLLVGGAWLSYSWFLGARAPQSSQRWSAATRTKAHGTGSAGLEVAPGGRRLAARQPEDPQVRPGAAGPSLPLGAPAAPAVPAPETAKQKLASLGGASSGKLPGPARQAAAGPAATAAEPNAGSSPKPLPQEPPGPPAKPRPQELKSPGNSGLPSQTTAQKGENLTAIASKYYPGQPVIGLWGIVLANPKISRDDLIYPGQVLELPKIDFQDKTIQLKDKLLYVPYGLYYSPKDLKKHTAWLTKANVKFLLLPSKDKRGKSFSRVFLGGYDKVEELQEAVKRLKKK